LNLKHHSFYEEEIFITSLKIPGWTLEFDFNKLLLYECEFSRKDIDPSTLNYYLRRGEYDTDFPLSILKKSNKYYLITNVESLESKFFKINQIIGKVRNQETKNLETYCSDELRTYFYTLIVHFFIKLGYKAPVKTRTFLGKSSKGKLVRRQKTPIKKIELKNNEDLKSIEVDDSVNFDVFLDKKLAHISFLPNYVIYQKNTNLPLNKDQLRLIEENEEWQDTIYFNPKTFFEKFDDVNDKIIVFLKELSFVKEISITPDFPLNKLETESIFYINPIKEKLKITNNEKFEKQMELFFFKNQERFPILSVIVLIDNYSNDNVYNLKLNKYLEEINNCSFINILKTINFTKIEDIDFEEGKKYIFLINDNCPGTKFLYDQLKKRTRISKNIYFSTISKIKNYTQHFFLIWLSLYYRERKNLVWYKSKDHSFENAVYIMIHHDYDLSIIKVLIFKLNLKHFSTSEYTYSFLLPFNNKYKREDIVKSIINFIKNNTEIFTTDNILFLTNNEFTQHICKEINNSTNLILIEKPNLRIFEINYENKKSKPQNGSYIKISGSDSKYLLITTGKPEENLGLPNPIRVNIINNLNGIEDKTILQLIFDLSFYQPKSFSKTGIPFFINHVNNKIYKKIPIKYSKEVPY